MNKYANAGCIGFVGLVTLIGCVDQKEPEPNATASTANSLGIVAWKTTTAPDGQITMLGQDASGNLIAEVDLLSGVFEMSDYYAKAYLDDGASAVVDGRRLVIKINGKQAYDWENSGHDDVMLPAPEKQFWQVDAVVQDPEIKAQFGQAQIQFEPSHGSLADGETAYSFNSGYQWGFGIWPDPVPNGYSGYYSQWKSLSVSNGMYIGVCTGGTNNGGACYSPSDCPGPGGSCPQRNNVICNGNVANGWSNGPSGYALGVVHQRAGIESGYDQDYLNQCCTETPVGTAAFFATQTCGYGTGAATQCGTAAVCAPCGKYTLEAGAGNTWCNVDTVDTGSQTSGYEEFNNEASFNYDGACSGAGCGEDP